jgi:ubiquinone/menaquinone biosynthesis C-methylase UbiE
MRFTTQNMQTIMSVLKKELEEHSRVCFEVLNPDIKKAYGGEKIRIEGETYIYRSLKSWIELAQILHAHVLLPVKINENIIALHFEKLCDTESFHLKQDNQEKYGMDSVFAKIHKNEEPAFIYYYEQALLNAKVHTRKRILNLGINSGEEFDVIKRCVSNFEQLQLVGIDYCASAIQHAKEQFNEDNIEFIQGDITQLEVLNLGQFDLIISIGTLQSSNLKFNETLMNIVQKYLKKEGAMILGFPNCRWIDTQMIYGAKVKNYAYSELSNVLKDASFSKKYLQQKKFRVTITGQHYLFLTATSFVK